MLSKPETSIEMGLGGWLRTVGRQFISILGQKEKQSP